MKPTGWRFESHRHALAAKGVKTNTYMAGKISKMAVAPRHADITAIDNSRKEHLNEMVKAEEDKDFERMHSESIKAIHTGQELSGAIQDRRDNKNSLRNYIGADKEQPLSLIKAIDPKVTDLRRADTENIREFDSMHDVGTDYEEIKENLQYMQEQYEEMGISPERARRRAHQILQKSKAFEDALNTTDDPDEFMALKEWENDKHYALKDDLDWFKDLGNTKRVTEAYMAEPEEFGESEEARLAYASPTEQFMQSAFFAKKKPWEVPLR